VLWYPTQAQTGLEWDTQPSLPAKPKALLIPFSEPRDLQLSFPHPRWVPHSSPVLGLSGIPQHSMRLFPRLLRHVRRRRHFPHLFAHQLLGVIPQQLFFRLDVHQDFGDLVHPLPHLVSDGVSNEVPLADR
jgi:hypothetical protein